jgi:hypothetical protein
MGSSKVDTNIYYLSKDFSLSRKKKNNPENTRGETEQRPWNRPLAMGKYDRFATLAGILFSKVCERPRP